MGFKKVILFAAGSNGGFAINRMPDQGSYLGYFGFCTNGHVLNVENHFEHSAYHSIHFIGTHYRVAGSAVPEILSVHSALFPNLTAVDRTHGRPHGGIRKPNFITTASIGHVGA